MQELYWYVHILTDLYLTYLKCTKITQPSHKHGTTLPRPGLVRNGVAHNWSTHIKEAYAKAHPTNADGQYKIVDATLVEDM
jgi:hypothetical protein